MPLLFHKAADFTSKSKKRYMIKLSQWEMEYTGQELYEVHITTAKLNHRGSACHCVDE